jgi:Na+-transporting methylmalonyl-CoA/oxaloacetate decarboxylase gamma subunit
MSNDFVGIGGALIVCLIAQSIVFIALTIMAGVIYLVGLLAGEKNGLPAVAATPALAPQATPAEEQEDGEIAAAIMGALTAELGGAGANAKSGTVQASSWRLVSLQEAAKGRIRK